MNFKSKYLLLSLLLITLALSNGYCTQIQIEISRIEKKLISPKANSYQ